MRQIIFGDGVMAKQKDRRAFMSYVFVSLTIILTVFAQIVIKWQVSKAGIFPELFHDKCVFLGTLLLKPWIIISFFAAFLGAVSWMAAMTKLELSHAYPFIGLTFVLVLILSSVFFHEAITLPKAIGIALVVAGIAIGSQG